DLLSLTLRLGIARQGDQAPVDERFVALELLANRHKLRLVGLKYGLGAANLMLELGDLFPNHFALPFKGNDPALELADLPLPDTLYVRFAGASLDVRRHRHVRRARELRLEPLLGRAQH